MGSMNSYGSGKVAGELQQCQDGHGVIAASSGELCLWQGAW